jgi:predicted Zn-dependent protease
MSYFSGASTSTPTTAPLARRVQSGERPVMTCDELLALGQRILRMTTLDAVDVQITHSARMITRLANDRILSSDDGETVEISIRTSDQDVPPFFSVWSNQLDDNVLRAGIQQCERMVRANFTYGTELASPQRPLQQDATLPVKLWHESTIRAMTASRETMIPTILETIRRERLQGSGFIGLLARSNAIIMKDSGITYFHDETDGEVSVTARSTNGRLMGMGGQAARDWSQIDPVSLTQHAVSMAKSATEPVAVEPGRRTAILTPEAAVQLLRYLTEQWGAFDTDAGHTALSKSSRGGNKLGQRVVDSRLTMWSDPSDPNYGYRPYFLYPWAATPKMSWVESGTLKNLAYAVNYAMDRGKAYASLPFAFQLSGGTTPVEQMIAQCQDGILVNRFSDVQLIDLKTCLLTGVTNGGCFLVKDGKIQKAVKNFRFLESPFFFLNRIEALGVPRRAAFGYTPKEMREPGWDAQSVWPRPPIVVPPMMVRDFNFSALADMV